MSDESNGPGRAPNRVLWWLLPLIVAGIAVAIAAAIRGGDGSSPAYPLY